MGKSNEKKKNWHERREIIVEVFKKSKKRQNTQKFDQAKKISKPPQRKPDGNFNRDRVADLDSKFNSMRNNGMKI